MLISRGKPAPTEPWQILEVAMNQAPDVIAIRLSKELKQIHEKAVEVLIPFRRNANGEPEWLVEHVYVRGANGSLSKLARIPGIDCIRKEQAPSYWIDQLLAYEQPEPQRLMLGSFVRVLTGPCARMCGTIAAFHAATITVGINMPTKRIKVHTGENNLQVVQCPPEQQTFFYHPDLFA